jgi:hypothetical protein
MNVNVVIGSVRHTVRSGDARDTAVARYLILVARSARMRAARSPMRSPRTSGSA